MLDFFILSTLLTLFQIAEKKSPFLLIFIYVMPVRLYIFQL